MPITPIEAESLTELDDACAWEFGELCCVKFDYDGLFLETPQNQEAKCYSLSPETVLLINEGLELLESRLPWRIEGSRKATDDEWQTINDKLDLAQYEMSKAGACMPTGLIVPFSGDTAPTGWLLCDGSEVDRTTYATLFNLIGTIYGPGDGSTTFNLPNMRGRMPVGLDGTTEFLNLGQTGGEKTHTLTIDEMPAHAHSNGAMTTIINGGVEAPAPAAITTNTGLAGGGQAHNNLQPYVVVNYVIKT